MEEAAHKLRVFDELETLEGRLQQVRAQCGDAGTPSECIRSFGEARGGVQECRGAGPRPPPMPHRAIFVLAGSIAACLFIIA
jgi:hypothetical protein